MMVAVVCAGCTDNGPRAVVDPTTVSTDDSGSGASAPSVPQSTNPRPAAPSTIPKTPWTTVARGCPAGTPRGEVTVLAASSLANIIPLVEGRLREAFPCVSGLNVSYGSSSVLAAQILNGAPADVFISASESPMNSVLNAGVASNPVRFASNLAEIMVSNDSPFAGKVRSLLDLLDSRNPGITVGLCVATAPCGSLANTVLGNARIAYGEATLARANVGDTETPSVEDLVTKIQLGELDAGLVYHSDCVHSERRGLARCVQIPLAEAGVAVNSLNVYVAAPLNDRGVSRDVMSFIAGAPFQSYLQTEHGFYAP